MSIILHVVQAEAVLTAQRIPAVFNHNGKEVYSCMVQTLGNKTMIRGVHKKLVWCVISGCLILDCKLGIIEGSKTNIEGESGSNLGQMTIMEDVLIDPACSDSWIEVSSGTATFTWDSGAPSLPTDRAEFSVNLPQAGTYYVWLRFGTMSDTQDAFYVGFDVADMRRVFPVDGYPYDGSWVSDIVADLLRNSTSPAAVYLQ